MCVNCFMFVGLFGCMCLNWFMIVCMYVNWSVDGRVGVAAQGYINSHIRILIAGWSALLW